MSGKFPDPETVKITGPAGNLICNKSDLEEMKGKGYKLVGAEKGEKFEANTGSGEGDKKEGKDDEPRKTFDFSHFNAKKLREFAKAAGVDPALPPDELRTALNTKGFVPTKDQIES